MAEEHEDALTVSDLRKVFRDFWRRPKVEALRGVSLSVRRGEIFGLLGPNGSGKSTTLKIALGLLHASSGTVRVLGCPPSHVGIKRRIGYLPEDSYLYRHLTARETMHFYGKLFGLDSAALKRRTEELLEAAGLSEAADRAVGEFSKGMARRLGLAQALVNDPSLVILDEPTAGLDPVGCRHIKDLLLSLKARGTTVVLSSHLLADVEDICDRIAILYRGRVRAQGRVKDLLEQSDCLRFTLPDQSAETVAAVRAWLREQTGSEPEVDRPKMNLESFFLDVVHQAAAVRGNEPAAMGTTDRDETD